MTQHPTVWLLLDNRASHRAQILGVAERLPWAYQIKELHYNKLAGLANILGGHTWHLTPESRAAITGPWPDLVIAAGRRAAPVSRAIKKLSPTTRIVHLMWPDMSPKAFDLIALPKHDAHKSEGPNILYTHGAPNRVTRETLHKEAARWQNQAARLSHPRIALLVGGNGYDADYEDADFKALAAYASAEAERLAGSLLVTTSPRTGAAAEALIKPLLTAPHIFHSFKPQGDNPYMAFLGLADVIIATGDSVSMCSEACTTGKPVYIFTPPHLKKDSKGFRDTLFSGGHAKEHTYPIRLQWQPTPLPDAAGVVAQWITTKLFPAAERKVA